MRTAVNFWSGLPESICNDISVKDKNTDCWNGIGKGRLVLLVNHVWRFESTVSVIMLRYTQQKRAYEVNLGLNQDYSFHIGHLTINFPSCC